MQLNRGSQNMLHNQLPPTPHNDTFPMHLCGRSNCDLLEETFHFMRHMGANLSFFCSFKNIFGTNYGTDGNILWNNISFDLQVFFSNHYGEPSILLCLPLIFPLTPEVKAGFLLFWYSALMSVAQYPHP